MKVININKCHSSPAPKEWAQIPAIKAAYPAGRGYVEISLQKLEGFRKSINLVQWMGAKNGFWHPASDIFLVSNV